MLFPFSIAEQRFQIDVRHGMKNVLINVAVLFAQRRNEGLCLRTFTRLPCRVGLFHCTGTAQEMKIVQMNPAQDIMLFYKIQRPN